MVEVEKLDVRNIIEVGRIKQRIIKDKDLLSMFEFLCSVANKSLNKEGMARDSPLEPNIEPELSDHESDDYEDEGLTS